MNRFEYIRPATLAEAIAAGEAPGSAFLAAGTNLVDLMKTGAARPARLVDLTRLPGLDRVEMTPGGGARIGALVRNADLARHPAFAAAFPAVAEALLSGASPQLRNAATVGGNLIQHTRCAYFTDPASPCNRRDPGAGCAARGGETRGHAILGWSDACVATHPSDFCVPLAALDALVEIEGPAGARVIPLADLHPLPGDAPGRESVLAPGEIIVALRLPDGAAAFRDHSRYLKIRERTSFAFALISAAAALDIAEGVVRGARIALGAVAAKPWRAPEAEALLVGEMPGAAVFARAAEAALIGARPSGDNAYKIELAKRVVTRALLLAAAGTPDRAPALPASVFAEPGVAAHA